jgi:hypothetical protein
MTVFKTGSGLLRVEVCILVVIGKDHPNAGKDGEEEQYCAPQLVMLSSTTLNIALLRDKAHPQVWNSSSFARELHTHYYQGYWSIQTHAN